MGARTTSAIDSDTFRRVMGHFVTGVTVVTALDGEGRRTR
jgi:flavin reductase (DIM6/NTAB) family NADH-FMN oxidoreductase RutF